MLGSPRWTLGAKAPAQRPAIVERDCSRHRLNIRGQGPDAAFVGPLSRISAVRAWTLGAKAPMWGSVGVRAALLGSSAWISCANAPLRRPTALEAPCLSRASPLFDVTAGRDRSRAPLRARGLSLPLAEGRVGEPDAPICHGEQRVAADRHGFADRLVAKRPGGKPAPAAEPGRCLATAKQKWLALHAPPAHGLQPGRTFRCAP